MKELTIEEKAKRYDEAIERARYWEKNPTVWSSNDICQKLFPELKESEGERIMSAFRDFAENYLFWGKLGLTKEEAIAWLEKQGEQKPADKIEPKFHEGEWINGYYTNYKVLSVNNDGYVVEDVDGNKINILFENEKFHHLFTIADAKDGDVLEYQGEIFIIRELKKKVIASRTIEYYCCYDGEHFINNSIYSLMDDDLVNIHPSTHKQHNLLLQKMHEAGYEWDAEKKELKKNEPMPTAEGMKIISRTKCEFAEWSEEDEENIDTIRKALVRYISYDGITQGEEVRLDNWLKSRILQNTWKPSEEQMNALNYVVNLMASSERPTENDLYYNILKSLRQQLKKLRGE